MATVQSEEDICNLANSMLGNRNTINSIRSPKTDKEVVFAIWYPICRQYLLKKIMPNFALNRVVVSQKTVPDGYKDSYSFAYEYPARCLKLLGIGEITGDDLKATVENSLVFTNDDYGSGATLRIIDDVTDVNKFSPEFVINLAAELAKRVALAVTQDNTKKTNATKEAQIEDANTTALNAQENKPVRKCTSRFRAARFGTPVSNTEKR